MGVYFGQSGEIALKRDALQAALQTKLDPFDVNTSTKRFSVDHSSGSLLTGDEVEIGTVDDSNLDKLPFFKKKLEHSPKKFLAIRL